MKISILNLNESDEKKIYMAVKLIEEVVENNNGTYFSSYIDDFKNNSIIHLELSNTKNDNIE